MTRIYAIILLSIGLGCVAALQLGTKSQTLTRFIRLNYQQEHLAERSGQASGVLTALGDGWIRYSNPRSHYSLEIPAEVYTTSGATPIPFTVFEDTFDAGANVSNALIARFDTAYDLIPAERIADVPLPKGTGDVKVLRGAYETNASPYSLSLHVRSIPDGSSLMDVLKSTFPNCPFSGVTTGESQYPGTFNVNATTNWTTLQDLSNIADSGCSYGFSGNTVIKYSPKEHLIVFANEPNGFEIITKPNQIETPERRMFSTFRFE